jgi:aldehyde:ferredoxin oxidoreductase
MEMGAAIGVAMEAKILAFGDSMGAIKLLEEIPQNTPLGRIIGNGTAVAGKIFGVTRVPTVKGQSMAAYDPRSNKGIGVTYMSSAMGADHTAGCVMPGRKGFDSSKNYDVLQPGGQEELSLDLQMMVAVYDALGLCFFIGLGLEELKTIAELHHAKYGSNVTVDALVEMGRDLLKKEHEFNLSAGICPVSSLPEFFEIEELPPYRTRFDVDLDVVKQHVNKELSIKIKG